MWTSQKPRAPGFYWHRDLSGDIEIVMRDQQGQLWSSKLDDESEVLPASQCGWYWHTPIWPLPTHIESSWLHDILIRKKWLQ
jgi:hypothetical protein